MKLSFTLTKSKPAPVATVSTKLPSLFATEEEGNNDTLPASKVQLPHVEASKAIKKRIEAEKRVDNTVYQYDEVWDKMQEAKQRQKEAKEVDATQRKPKYIHSLLTSAATRKLDYLRAEEKMMQLERETEGDEFKDKESFVTQAYKDQMAEVRKAEEEENAREELRKKQDGSSTGMAHFYRKLLEESEKNHDATVAATQKRVIGPQGPNPNLTITKPANFTPTSDVELARLAREQGKEVELNDDNQIVDKRELLAAGLNLSLPNTRRLGLQKGQQKSADAVPIHRAAGVAASRREINERRAREIQQQLEDERERSQKEQREIDEEAIRRTVAKRNTEVDVESARERYLQRKRQRVEEASKANTMDTNMS